MRMSMDLQPEVIIGGGLVPSARQSYLSLAEDSSAVYIYRLISQSSVIMLRLNMSKGK